MNSLLPGIIMSFREGLEAFLILILIVRFLQKTDNRHLIINVILGLFSSVVFSLIIGYLLFYAGSQMEKMDQIGKLWESVASLAAVGLVTSFIIWMIQHGSEIKNFVENKTAINLTKLGIFTVTFILIAREGVEIAIFSFAGRYNYQSIMIGIILSIILSSAIYFSLFKVKIASIFKITLLYLIIQAGYLAGYGIHEGLGAMKSLGYLGSDNLLLVKVYDLSNSVLNHKEGIVGLPLNVLFGWYSKPEWIQFLIQYGFTGSLLTYWFRKNK
ncbi:MAG: hydrogenase [Spirochaetae bacterium HGW-Spirochaetae-5]|nr:MAG: hydrogenase [Spirochaetae bacterium HGW-Spirochaetae-5]